MRGCLKRVHAALYLSPGELLGVARCLKAIRLCKEALESAEDCPLLGNLAQWLQAHRSIEEEIGRCIAGEEEISDGASPALLRIRRSMRIANDRVRERLGNMIRSATFQKYLQEPLVTIRNGRFVLPVKQEYRQNVPGLIHDQSGSGATLFIRSPRRWWSWATNIKSSWGRRRRRSSGSSRSSPPFAPPIARISWRGLGYWARWIWPLPRARLGREMDAVQPEMDQPGLFAHHQGPPSPDP